MLTGKYDRNKVPTDMAMSRFAFPGRIGELYRGRYWVDQVFDIVDQLKKIADGAGIPLTTLAVAWVLANPAITSPIVGASRPEQLEATVAAMEVKIPEDVKAEMDKATMQFR